MNNISEMKNAALMIEDCWCRYRDQQMFQLLKHAICSADNHLTHEIMRKISPMEAELLNDPVFQTKIRFRFAGEEFPPCIVFKIFIRTNGVGLKYLSGRKTITPASEAAVDSLSLMGNRKFLEQMLADRCEEQQCRVNDVLDVANLQDYMKYLSKIDETSAKAGGKENSWRKLSLEAVPRQHIIYDVLTYLQTRGKTEKMQQYLRQHLLVPLSQTQQVEYMHLLSSRKSPSNISEPSRRSRQTRSRVAKMKKAYYDKASFSGDDTETDVYSPRDEMTRNEEANSPIITEIDFDDETWDDEGQLLFEWTKNLSDDNVAIS